MGSVIEVREPQASFDLTVPDGVLELGVDGISNALIGFPVSKVVFHVVTLPKPDSPVEQRKAVTTITINTLALIQFCQQTLTAFASSREKLEGAAEQFAVRLREMASSISPPE